MDLAPSVNCARNTGSRVPAWRGGGNEKKHAQIRPVESRNPVLEHQLRRAALEVNPIVACIGKSQARDSAAFATKIHAPEIGMLRGLMHGGSGSDRDRGADARGRDTGRRGRCGPARGLERSGRARVGAARSGDRSARRLAAATGWTECSQRDDRRHCWTWRAARSASLWFSCAAASSRTRAPKRRSAYAMRS